MIVIEILAGIIVICIAIGVGLAVLMGVMALILAALGLVFAVGQIVVEAVLWLLCWVFELEVRKTWRPWQHWGKILKYAEPDFRWYDNWEKRRMHRKIEERIRKDEAHFQRHLEQLHAEWDAILPPRGEGPAA